MFRERRRDGLRKTLEPVHARNQDVFDAPVLELRQNVQPTRTKKVRTRLRALLDLILAARPAPASAAPSAPRLPPKRARPRHCRSQRIFYSQPLTNVPVLETPGHEAQRHSTAGAFERPSGTPRLLRVVGHSPVGYPHPFRLDPDFKLKEGKTLRNVPCGIVIASHPDNPHTRRLQAATVAGPIAY